MGGSVRWQSPPLRTKIVQRATTALLNAIYEEEFLGFSYGFRPGRGQHDALDALRVGIDSRKVNHIHLVPTACGTPAPDRRNLTRHAGRDGCLEPLPDRSDRRFRMVIATSFVIVLRQPLESALTPILPGSSMR
jgi:hypothetical protein